MPRLARDYCVYVRSAGWLSDEQAELARKAANVADMGAHAGVSETAMMMHLVPELVRTDQQDPKKSYSLGRLDSVKAHGIRTGFDWYADFPAHFAGDFTGATPEVGKMLFDMSVDNLAEAIKTIKNDDVSPQLAAEYAGYGKNPDGTPEYY